MNLESLRLRLPAASVAVAVGCVVLTGCSSEQENTQRVSEHLPMGMTIYSDPEALDLCALTTKEQDVIPDKTITHPGGDRVRAIAKSALALGQPNDCPGTVYFAWK